MSDSWIDSDDALALLSRSLGLSTGAAQSALAAAAEAGDVRSRGTFVDAIGSTQKRIHQSDWATCSVEWDESRTNVPFDRRSHRSACSPV